MAKPVPVLASTDLSSISRRSKSCVTTVSILEPNMDWLTLGEAHLIRKNSDRGWSLDAYGLEGITDFEHDSIKIMSLPLIGVELKHVYYHTTVLLAWVIPNLGPFQEFHVPRSGYDPLQNGGSILDTANSVSCTLSHEVLEMWWDPQVNIWYEAKDGILWAGEICDPVEASSYPVYLGLQTIVQVSNFVLPPFFDAHPEKGVAFDFMGSLKKPFSLDKGGYAVTRTVRGKVSEIYGSRYSKWKLAGKKFPAARTARRK